MALLKQCATVSRLNLSGLRQRLWASLVIVVGMACVVGVLLAMLSATYGLLRAFENSGSPLRAIIFADQVQGSAKESINRETIATVLDAPGIAKGADGHLLGDGEVDQWLPPAAGFAEGSLRLRGIGPAGIAVRPQFRIVSGRMFQKGRHELVVGVGAQRVFGLKAGRPVQLKDGEWPIVGVFADGGSVLEGELVADVDTVMATWKRTSYDSVLVSLHSPAAFTPLKDWLTSNPTVGVTAVREPDYYLRNVTHLTPFFTAMAYLVGAIMAGGALVGGMRIMYAAVGARTREIATLRAIGFGPVPVAASVLVECAALSLCGAVIGALVAWLIFDGRHSSLGSSIFDLYVSPGLISVGLGWALLIALVGGLLPAVRAARVSVVEALRSG